MPMFPLGGVLLPGMFLPLRVFEMRYRALMNTVIHDQEAPEFGVVMIERGFEVGGGDVRSMVGTVADVLQAAELPNGQLRVQALGMHRIRVNHWLPDDPYPVAEIERWEDPAPGPELESLHHTMMGKLRRSLALASELGQGTVPATVELSDDLLIAGYQAAGIAPLGPLDKFNLLCAPSPEARVRTLAELLDDASEMLAFRLGGDLDDDLGNDPTDG
ncbi:MAG: LON peptidase substrate-binding domain-containing protein [Acidimicrobiia bacterium]